MTEELINTDGIGTALVYIADKIGITVEQMYHIYVGAQVTMATVQIVMIATWFIVVALTIVFVYMFGMRSEKQEHPDRNKDAYQFDVIVVSVSVGTIVGILLALVLAFMYVPIIAYLCPEYTALKSLMSDLSTITNILK